MPISIPAISKPRVAVRDLKSLGFTLVELMVVLVILGLASAAVVMTIPDPGGGLRADMQRFAARLSAARDRAIVAARPLHVWALRRASSRGGGWPYGEILEAAGSYNK